MVDRYLELLSPGPTTSQPGADRAHRPGDPPASRRRRVRFGIPARGGRDLGCRAPRPYRGWYRGPTRPQGVGGIQPPLYLNQAPILYQQPPDGTDATAP